MSAETTNGDGDRRCSRSRNVSKYFGNVIALKDVSCRSAPAR